MIKILAIPALLALLSGAPAGAAEPATPSVQVNAARGAGGNPNVVNAAKSRILNGKSASSCAFMDDANDPSKDRPDISKDEVYQAYMSDFGLDNDMSNDAAKSSVYAPTGDVSIIVDGIGGNLLTAGTACTLADWRFAAGRQRILRNDKTLAEGYEAFDHGDYARALDLFTAAWDKVGYNEAALMLARLHLYGLGVSKDTPKAIHWLEQVVNGRYDAAEDQVRFDPAQPAAATPKAEAAFMLARIHERGIGLPADQQKARRWYAKAADLGFVPAQDILGLALLAGRGGPAVPARGVAMLKAAGEAGYLPAAYHLGVAYHAGDGVARDDAQAFAWFSAAAKAGLPAAMFAAGRMLDLGEGTKADPARALVYYKDAALKGDRDAQFALGTYFYSGEVVAKDAATARKWFEAAAHQGQVDAMFNLGAMLAAGEGGARDTAMAFVWLSLAADTGYEQATPAARALAPQLTADDRSRAEAILKPVAAR